MSKLVLNTDQNYQAAILGAIGTNMFRHLYVTDENGEESDAARDGDRSCALFVTSVLFLFGRIDAVRATVTSTVKSFEQSAHWTQTATPVAGDVVEYASSDGATTGHVGFFLNSNEVISNVSAQHTPAKHALVMEKNGVPVAFWHWCGDIEQGMSS